MTVEKLRRAWKERVAPEDFFLLIERISGKRREFLLAHPEYILTAKTLRKARAALERRSGGEPIAYLLGEKEFSGRPFFVNQQTLIPRPETEVLVDAARAAVEALCRSGSAADVVDVGTGCGNVIITLAKEHRCRGRHFSFFATDISPGALAMAKKNSKRHGVAKKIQFIQSDLLGTLLRKRILRKEKIIVIANLPYVAPKIYQKNRWALRFEPETALVSAQSGLSHYFRLLQALKKLQDKEIQAFLEISPEQAKPLRAFFQKEFPGCRSAFRLDYSKRNRVAIIEFPPLPSQ